MTTMSQGSRRSTARLSIRSRFIWLPSLGRSLALHLLAPERLDLLHRLNLRIAVDGAEGIEPDLHVGLDSRFLGLRRRWWIRPVFQRADEVIGTDDERVPAARGRLHGVVARDHTERF